MERQIGFTLIELAIVLAVVAFVIGGLLVPLSMQIEQQKVRETRKELDEIKEALIGFAIVNRYLPCPAVSWTDGNEDRNSGTHQCNKRVGFVPWGALGVSKLDSWGHIFAYSVTPAYSDATTFFSFSSARDITVRTRDAADNLINLSNASDIPVVVLSYGKNGYFGTTDTGGVVPNTSPSNPDEITNQPADPKVFVDRPISVNTAGASGEFDDLVAWLSPNILFNRMVAAGRLP